MTKKNVYAAAIVLITVLAACSNNQITEPVTEMKTCSKYSCPMHPDNTSTTLEKCPTCEMQMVPVTDTTRLDTVKHLGK